MISLCPNAPDRLQREEGFTLVELLVVIVIIGAIAAIAVPTFMNQRKKANDAAVNSDLANKGIALETARLTNDEGTPREVAEEMAPSTKGVTWDLLTYTDEGFCLVGWHENGYKYSPEEPATYDSLAGGLNREEKVACPEVIAPGYTPPPLGGGEGVVMPPREALAEIEVSTAAVWFDGDARTMTASIDSRDVSTSMTSMFKPTEPLRATLVSEDGTVLDRQIIRTDGFTTSGTWAEVTFSPTGTFDNPRIIISDHEGAVTDDWGQTIRYTITGDEVDVLSKHNVPRGDETWVDTWDDYFRWLRGEAPEDYDPWA